MTQEELRSHPLVVDRFDATYAEDWSDIVAETDLAGEPPSGGPLLAAEDTHSVFGYTAMPAWGRRDSRDPADINALQSEYSYLGGRRGEDQDFQHLGRPETGDPWTPRMQMMLRTGVLAPDAPVLTIGPRWAGEIRYFRDGIGLRNTVGLDLFSFDSDLIKSGDMHEMPFEDEQFALIYQRNTFNKSRDVRKALRECLRVLCPGGILISDDCLDYVNGVSPLARTNMKSNEWMIRFLRRFTNLGVLYNVETPSEQCWIRKIGQLMVQVKTP